MGAAGWSPAWIRRRAQNVYHRPLPAALTASAAFLAAFCIVLATGRPAGAPHRAAVTLARPDTVAAGVRVAAAMDNWRAAERTLQGARAANRVAPRRPDTLSRAVHGVRDSLAAAAGALDRLIQRARTAPLPASYEALASTRILRRDPRVQILVDSLHLVERARSDLTAVSGADPVFLELTGRLNATGAELVQIARAKRAALLVALARLTPPALPGVDTLPLLAARRAASLDVQRASTAFLHARRLDRVLDAAAARQRAAAEHAPRLAVLAAAGVIGLALGLGITFALEIRTPTVSDAAEIERLAGVRVLATIGRRGRHERERRAADREVPAALAPGTEGYTLLHAQLAGGEFTLPLVIVLGDHSLAVAAVAANLGAGVARGWRTALVVDAGAGPGVAELLGMRTSPGLREVLAGRMEWAATLARVPVGRGRELDVLVRGNGASGGRHSGARSAEDGGASWGSLAGALVRRYDTVVVSAGIEASAIEAAARSGGEVVLCVRPGRSRLATTRQVTAALTSAGARLRGVVFWGLPEPSEASAGGQKVPIRASGGTERDNVTDRGEPRPTL